MRNPENEVCFAQVGEHHNLSAIRIVPGPACIAVLEDGSEELFTTEIEPVILGPLQKQKDILIAHVDESGKAIAEYTVPLSIEL